MHQKNTKVSRPIQFYKKLKNFDHVLGVISQTTPVVTIHWTTRTLYFKFLDKKSVVVNTNIVPFLPYVAKTLSKTFLIWTPAYLFSLQKEFTFQNKFPRIKNLISRFCKFVQIVAVTKNMLSWYIVSVYKIVKIYCCYYCCCCWYQIKSRSSKLSNFFNQISSFKYL